MKAYKRCAVWLVAALMIFGAWAFGEETDDTLVTYTLPEGCQVYELAASPVFEVPAELTAMYQVMASDRKDANVHLFRMKNGRALVSVSDMPVEQVSSAESLLAAWPDIAAAMERELTYVDKDASCASIVKRFGFDALYIDTAATVTGESDSMLLIVTCTAFYMSDRLIEVWTATPSELSYLYDADSGEAAKSDRADMEALLNSFVFVDSPSADTEPQTRPNQVIREDETLQIKDDAGASQSDDDKPIGLPAVPYADPAGRFTLNLPTDAAMVTRNTDEQTTLALREKLNSLYGEPALKVFDRWMESVKTYDASFMILPEYGVAVGISSSDAGTLKGLSAAGLRSLSERLTESLARKFGSAQCLQDDQIVSLSNLEHALFNYTLQGEAYEPMLLDVYVCVDQNGMLHEVDCFTFMCDIDERLQKELTDTLLNSLLYTNANESL